MLMPDRFVAGIIFSLGVALSAKTSAAGPACLVRGNHVELQDVTVQPRGVEPFTVDIQDVPATIKIAPYAGGAATIEVQGPVRFTAQRKNLWLTLDQDFASADGLVSMRRGSKLVHAHLDGNAVVAAAVVYYNDVLSGEDKDADEFVVPVKVPCSTLTLDKIDDEALATVYENDEVAAAPRGATWWEPKSEAYRVRIYAQPTASARFVDIVHQGCSNCIEFVEVGKLGGWLNVQSYGEGVLARGWLHRSTVKPGLGNGRGWGCSGDHRHSVIWAPRKKNLIYAGPAKIPATTQVYARPGEAVWATVAEDIEVQVRCYAGDNWAQLVQVPGVTSWSHAYVPRSAVVIPNVNRDR
jgi:hypothetical protein